MKTFQLTHPGEANTTTRFSNANNFRYSALARLVPGLVLTGAITALAVWVR
jgi:hypothetical protein